MIMIGAEQGGVGGHQQPPADKIADIEREPGMRGETGALR